VEYQIRRTGSAKDGWTSSSTRGCAGFIHFAGSSASRSSAPGGLLDAEEFVWVIGYDGPDSFAAADRRYYASEERRAMSPDPAQLIEQPTQSMMRSVLPEP